MLDYKTIGKLGEAAAASYLQKLGYRILQRNYCTPIGELDIVCSLGNVLVFVEVKSRTSTSFGEAYLAVNAKKQQKLRKLALYYIMLECKAEPEYQFDIVSLWMQKQTGAVLDLQHYKNAFV
ncbi:MAG TPA: YraN family protein [Bacillota bacterium]|nr:YraN family protein [Bacillota bacterium]